MERSADLVVAVLAVVKAGGAYLPMDVRAPVERMQLVLADAGVSVLLTDRVWTTTAHAVSDPSLGTGNSGATSRAVGRISSVPMT